MTDRKAGTEPESQSPPKDEKPGAQHSPNSGDEGRAKKDDEDSEDGKGKTEDDDKDKKKVSALSKPWVRIALAVAALAVIVYGIYWYINYRNYGRYQQTTNDANLDADQVNISPRVAGYVDQVFVTDNQLVRRGQVLVRINAETSDATAAQSRAQIGEAQATVAQARATRTQQFDAIRQARAQADQSRATLRQYQATNRFNADQVARYIPLSRVGAETDEKLAQNRSTLEQSRAQVAGARAQLTASNAQVASARHQIAINDAQIESGLAQVASARAQLAASMVDVDAAAVTSRIAGRIGNRTVRVGQYVQIGTRMMTVVPVADLYLTANFKETQIGLMRIGQPATITVDALPGEELHGVLESFSPGTGSRFALVPTDNATGNFTKIVQRVPVRFRVEAGPQARRVLVPGLSVNVSVDTRVARNDTKVQREESKNSADARERDSARELQLDRERRAPGAGK